MLELCARAPLIVVAFFVTVRTRHQFLHLPRKIYGILLLPFLPMHECITTGETRGAERERERERQTSGHLSKSAASFAQPTPPSSFLPSASSCRHCHQILRDGMTMSPHYITHYIDKTGNTQRPYALLQIESPGVGAGRRTVRKDVYSSRVATSFSLWKSGLQSERAPVPAHHCLDVSDSRSTGE